MSDVTPPPAPPAAPQPAAAAPQPGTLPPVNVQPISYPAGERALVTPWNGMAIASLVLSVVGLSLIGVILGHIALSQIKRTGEQGYVLALIGVILGLPRHPHLDRRGDLRRLRVVHRRLHLAVHRDVRIAAQTVVCVALLR